LGVKNIDESKLERLKEFISFAQKYEITEEIKKNAIKIGSSGKFVDN
jgi:hypothetical protein